MPRTAFHRRVAVLHMTEDEVGREFCAVMLKVRQGDEVIIDRDHQPFAVLGPAVLSKEQGSQLMARLDQDSTEQLLIVAAP